MKRLFTLLCASFLVTSIAFSQDFIVMPVNTVNASHGLTGQNWDGNDARQNPKYIMTKVEGTDLYKCTIKLNAYFKTNKWKPANGTDYNPASPEEGWDNIHNYIVVPTDESSSLSVFASNKGRPFTVTEDGTDVTFYATVRGGQIKIVCDAQNLEVWGYPSDITQFPQALGKDYTSITGVFTSQIEFGLNVGNGDYQDISDGNRKIKWGVLGRISLMIDYNSIYYRLEKVIDNFDTPMINDVNAEDFGTSDLGTFNSTTPLNLTGGIHTTALSSVATENVTAKMYYQINDLEVQEAVLSTNDANAMNAEWEGLASDILNGLDLADGNHTIKIWFETECFGDTLPVKENGSNVYEASFAYEANGNSIEQQSVDNVKISIVNQTINATFEGEASVKLYSITGQLIDQVTAKNDFSKTVQQGIYIIVINNKSYKVVVR